MKRRLGKILAIVLMAFMLLTVAACSSGTEGGTTVEPKVDATKADGAKASEDKTADAADKVIKFAVMGPMTGDAAAQGKQQEFGVRLAVNEINAAGGINGTKLEYDVFDDQLKTDQAVICAEKIIANPDYRFVITSISSGCSIAAYPTLETKDLPVISGINTADHITAQGFKNYLRVCFKDSANLRQLANLAINEFGVKRPAVIYTASETDTSNFNQLKDILKNEHGVDIVATAQIEAETEKDYNAHITTFMGANADGLFCFSEYTPAGLLLKQKHAVGWDVQVFSLSGCSNPQIIDIAGAEAAEGFITMSGFDAYNPDPKVQKFVKDYEALSGFLPGEWAAGAYDSIYVVAEALKDPEGGKLHNSDFVEWMRANIDYGGIMGHVTFDEFGDNPSAAALILTVRDGKLVVRQ